MLLGTTFRLDLPGWIAPARLPWFGLRERAFRHKPF